MQVKGKYRVLIHDVLRIFYSGFLLNLFIELLSKPNMGKAISEIISHTHLFLLNWLVIVLFLSLSLFFKKKSFVCLLLVMIVALLGISNRMVMNFRNTPLSFNDLCILKLDFNFMQSYVSWSSILMMIGCTCLYLFILIIGWKNSEATKVHFKKSSTILGILMFITFVSYDTTVSADVIYASKGSEYGVITSFIKSTIERGMDEPDDYFEDTINDLILNTEDKQDKKTPNIIFVQLESFFDPNLLIGVEYCQNPIPNFTALKEKYTNGMLDVAVLGGGTVNSEFEVLTGMNLDYLGNREYPYETLLKDQTVDSLAYNLKDKGYETYAIHNNTATFYDRDLVYPNLGFDHFISSEYMEGTTKNPIGWIKDKHLTKEIINCLSDSDKSDFIFTISMQGHGAFPSEKLDENTIKVTNSPYKQELENQIEYYVSQLYEMDLFIVDLIEEVNQLNEDTIIVFYGDHLPPLQIEEEDLNNHNLYQTEYVIYATYEIEPQDEPLETYQLGAKVAQLAEMNMGIMATYHTLNREEFSYEKGIELLMYDMLYGKNYALNQEVRIPSEMMMGIGG
ncbi:MAG: LTA synthase family protein [Erysipelotrichaceae bacterium]